MKAVPDTVFADAYRGFRLGAYKGLHGYRAMWKSSLEDNWVLGHVYSDTLESCKAIAEGCVDFAYRCEVFEIFNKRKPSCEEMRKL